MIWFLFVSFDDGCHVTQVYFESALHCVMWGWRQKPGLCVSKTSTLSTAPWSQQILSGLGVGRVWFSSSWSSVILRTFFWDGLLTSLASHCWTLAEGIIHHVMFPKRQFALLSVRDQGRATFSVPRLQSLSARSLFPPLNIYICLRMSVFFPHACVLSHVCCALGGQKTVSDPLELEL